MAKNKKIKLSFEVDGLVETASNLSELENNLGVLNKSFEGMDVGDKFKNLKKEVDAGGLSMRQLSKKIQEYQSIALEAGRTSPIGKTALLEAANLQDIVTDLRNEVTRLSSDGKNMQGALQVGGSVIAGYGALQGVMALTGIENEALVKGLVKMQAAQSVLTAIEQIRLSVEKESAAMMFLRTAQTKIATAAQTVYTAVIGASTGAKTAEIVATAGATTAQWSLNAAITANPIGLIVVAIGAAVAAFIFFKDTILDLLKVAFYPLILAFEAIKSGLQALGLIQSEEAKKLEKAEKQKTDRLRELHKQRMQMIDDEIEANRKNTDERVSFIDFEIAKLQAANKDTTELQRQKILVQIESTRKEIELSELRNEARIKELEIIAKMTGFVGDAARERLKEIEEEKLTLESGLTKLNQSLEIFDIKQETLASENVKKKSDERKKDSQALQAKLDKDNEAILKAELQRQIKEKEAKDAFLTELEVLDEEIYQASLSEEEREIIATQDKYFRLIEMARQYGMDTLALEEQQRLALKEIDDRYTAEEAALAEKAKLKKEENDAKELDDKKELENAKLEVAGQGFNLVSELATTFAGTSEAAQKKAFNVKKVADIASATLDGYRAVLSTYASTPGGPVIKGIAAGISGGFAVAQIAKIANTKYEGGGSSGGVSAGVSGGSAPSVPTPSTATLFGTSGAAGGDSEQSGVQDAGTRQTNIIKAVVVESDITNSQKRISNYQETAEID